MDWNLPVIQKSAKISDPKEDAQPLDSEKVVAPPVPSPSDSKAVGTPVESKASGIPTEQRSVRKVGEQW